MKTLLIGLLVIGSASTFAEVKNVGCEEVAYRQIVSAEKVDKKLKALLKDIEVGENMEKALDITDKAKEIAKLSCEK
jgi:L-fucose isomerase-like protein